MKKYTKPSIEVVELSVKESLSALPSSIGFNGVTTRKLGTSKYNNVTIYTKSSSPDTVVPKNS